MFLGEFEDPAAAARNTRERIIRNHHGQAGLFHEQFIHVAQQGASAGQDDAAFGHVGAEFGRGLFQRLLDGADDALQRFLEAPPRLPDIRVQGEVSGTPFLLCTGP